MDSLLRKNLLTTRRYLEEKIKFAKERIAFFGDDETEPVQIIKARYEGTISACEYALKLLEIDGIK